jgi:acetyl-CoA carboxylase biotin carboxylase subunit
MSSAPEGTCDSTQSERALDEFVVDGIETTLPLFRALVRDKDIVDGSYHIRWLEQFLAGGGMAD